MKYFTKCSFPSNCGMEVLCSFSDQKPRKGELEADLKEAFEGSSGTIVAFSGNDIQEKECEWGPKQFADWLNKRGEKVTRTAHTVSHCSGRIIQAFYWIPSLKFRKKYRMEISRSDDEYL